MIYFFFSWFYFLF